MADTLSVARRVIDTEVAALQALRDGFDDTLVDALSLIEAAEGRVILAGVGKSGHVARKIAATFASTGTPAQFVHPTEASHGDLGMVTPQDCVIALSKSGETRELADIVAYCQRFGCPLIAITAKAGSMLAIASDVALIIPDAPEACAETRAPTTSTTLMMALGDALAVALLELRGFKADDFKVFHPGGALGAALAKAEDLMHTGNEAPLVEADTPMSEVLITMTAKGLGCAGVVASDGRLLGVITDGDLRRSMGAQLLDAPARAVMSSNPRVIAPGTSAADAMRLMTTQTPRVTVLFVVENARPVGVLHIHDLLRAGVS